MLKNNSFSNSCTNAFTLMEVLITVIIVGLLSSIAFSKYVDIVGKQKAKEGEQILFAIYARQKAGSLEGDNSCNDFGVVSKVPDNFNSPTVSCIAILASPSWVQRTIAIASKDGAYSLQIVWGNPAVTTYPQVTCSSGTADLCAKLGY